VLLRSVPADEYTDLELDGTLRAIEPWWDLLVEGLDPRPAAHLRVRQLDVAGGDLHAAVRSLRRRLQEGTARDEAVRFVRDSLALLAEAGRAFAAAGAYATGRGQVAGLFRSGGGVPKLPVAEAAVGPRGIEGDVQRTRQHHGRPWQALCLWSAEVVARLAGEGHPIVPGAAGENISVSGLDWPDVRPGTRLLLGSEVVAEVAPYALPCSKNARWFLGGDFERMGHAREAGISRAYASVLRGGTLRVGDAVVLEPDLGD
jgi:MOSC domain-containing protein YiiM